MVTDMLNVAYVIIKEFVNIKIVNGFPSKPIVILGIPVIPKGTHLHAFKRLPQLAHLLLHSPHHPLELLEFNSQRSLLSLDVSLVVGSRNNISLMNGFVVEVVVVV